MRRACSHPLLPRPASSRSNSRFLGRTVCDTVEPVCDFLAGDDRSGLASQNQKSRLEGIFRLMRIVQDARAYSKDHGTVSPYEHCEGFVGGLIAQFDEALEELFVVQVREHSAVTERRQVPEHFPCRTSRHERVSSPVFASFYL